MVQLAKFGGKLKPFSTNWKNPNGILGNPLLQLQKAACARGIANEDGFRLVGAPWAFQLAETNQNQSLPPIIRTIGFQRVSEKGIDFLMMRGKEEIISNGNATKRGDSKKKPMSLSYTEGVYPPLAEGGLKQNCEQWRAEGPVVELLTGILNITDIVIYIVGRGTRC